MLHRDQLSSMWQLLIKRSPSASLLLLLTYPFHLSIARHFGPKNAFFTVRLQSRLRVI
jgi:hypothetical protein